MSSSGYSSYSNDDIVYGVYRHIDGGIIAPCPSKECLRLFRNEKSANRYRKKLIQEHVKTSKESWKWRKKVRDRRITEEIRNKKRCCKSKKVGYQELEKWDKKEVIRGAEEMYTVNSNRVYK